MAKNFFLAFFGGVLMGYLGKDLGVGGIAIGIFSASALLTIPYTKNFFGGNTAYAALFLFLMLFEIGGFTIAAYPSATRAVEFYGDFHDKNIYEEITTKPLSRTAPLFILPAEARLAALIPWGENAEGVILILLGLINRLLALIILLFIGKEISNSGGTALLGAYAFSFSYRLIPFTQGMKFVAGMPFLLLWLLLTVRQENGKKNIPFLQELFFIAALFSEQWTASFAAAIFFSHALFKAATKKRFFSAESHIGAILTTLTGTWYVIERLRFVSDKPFLMNVFPQFELPIQTTRIPLFAVSIFSVVALIGITAWRRSHTKRTDDKKGHLLLAFAISPLTIAAACSAIQTKSALAYFTSPKPMLLIGTALGLLAAPSAPPLVLAGLLAAGAHYILIYAGILVISSPYLSSFAAPFAIFGLPHKKAFFIPAIVITTLSGSLFLWQFLSYIPDTIDIAYPCGAITALTALSYATMFHKKSHAA